MSVELRQAPIEGVFELLCPPFMDTRGAFLNVFRAHEQSTYALGLIVVSPK